MGLIFIKKQGFIESRKFFIADLGRCFASICHALVGGDGLEPPALSV